MDPLLLLGRCLLAAVLAVAGFSKLHTRAGSRDALAGFGVPASVIAPASVLLPAVELAIAALLVPARTAWWGAAGALTLLLVFTAAIVANLRSGRAPRCNCFGQIHSSPIHGSMVVRNAALAAFAGLMVWMGPGAQPGLTALGSTGLSLQFSPAVSMIILIGLLTLGIGSVVLAQVIRQQGRLLHRIERLERASSSADPMRDQGLPIGAPAPAFELDTLSGERLGLDRLLDEKRSLVLIFSNPECGPCAALMPDVAVWQRDPAGVVRVAVMTSGSDGLNRAMADRHGLRDVFQDAGDVGRQYRIDGTPSAVLIRPDRTIGSRTAFGRDAIERLIFSSAGAGDDAGKGHGMAA